MAELSRCIKYGTSDTRQAILFGPLGRGNAITKNLKSELGSQWFSMRFFHGYPLTKLALKVFGSTFDSWATGDKSYYRQHPFYSF